MASDRAEIYSERFYPNFNYSTSESSFEGFEQYEVSFRQIPTKNYSEKDRK